MSARRGGTDMSRMQGLTLPANVASFVARQREQADRLRAQHGIEAQPWYRITNATSPDEAEILLYDEIGGWYGATADEFIEDLRAVTSPNLRVRVNSPGGSVFEGIAIANALRSHPAIVTIQIDGIAASIASVIAMAGDRVEMAPNTMLMIHEASGLCMGDASDMEEMAVLLGLISDNIADAYAARAGGTREQWREQMRAETWYLPDDAVTAGLADEAIPTPKRGEPIPEPEPGEDEPMPVMHREFDLTAYGYQGPKQPEQPKPTPPPAAPEPGEVTLTFNVGNALDGDLVDVLRKMVAKRAPETVPEVVGDPEPAAEPEVPAVPEPAATAEPAEPPAPVESDPAPVDEWAADLAHLTTEPADEWAADLAHLIYPDSSSSAATSA